MSNNEFYSTIQFIPVTKKLEEVLRLWGDDTLINNTYYSYSKNEFEFYCSKNVANLCGILQGVIKKLQIVCTDCNVDGENKRFYAKFSLVSYNKEGEQNGTWDILSAFFVDDDWHFLNFSH